MVQLVNLRTLIDDLERQRPDLIGKIVADIPELAGVRFKFRRSFYHWAEACFGMAVLNLSLAVIPGFAFWPVSAFGAAVAVWSMIESEKRARAMTRQLKRPVAEQFARDLVGLRD